MKNKKEERSNLRDAAGLATAGYIGKKGITNALPGALGLQMEEHTTSKKNAKKILKSGYLDPKKGGSLTGASEAIGDEGFKRSSKGYVHITGTSGKKTLGEEVKSAVAKRAQRGMYHSVHSGDKSRSASSYERGMDTMKSGAKKVMTGRTKAKTLYTANTPEFYGKLKEDLDSGINGLKSKKKVNVSGNRISAMFSGLKRNGLNGIRQSPRRALAYGAGTVGVGAAAYMMGKDSAKSVKDKLLKTKRKKT